VDILINNAGRPLTGDFHDSAPEQWDAAVELGSLASSDARNVERV
jgi:NADP-dependent 3-hydroxy acid dehydrogenase YdfG